MANPALTGRPWTPRWKPDFRSEGGAQEDDWPKTAQFQINICFRKLRPETLQSELSSKANDPLLEAASFDAVMISNAYHEMTEHAAMVAHVRPALKTTGRLVVIESYVEGRRHLPRDEQTKKHEFSPGLLTSELRESGFEIVSRDEPLLLDGSLIKYLIAAQPARPAQASAQPDPASGPANANVYDATLESNINGLRSSFRRWTLREETQLLTWGRVGLTIQIDSHPWSAQEDTSLQLRSGRHCSRY